jgi:ribosomal protein S18 acetylase RimI-like enzyme
MEHVLDNPAWNALISGNKNLSFGNNQVKHFDQSVSPFVAFNENTHANFDQLYELLPFKRPALFVTPVEMEIPGPWKVLQVIKGVQMVCNGVTEQHKAEADLVPLTEAHITQMLELTKLTNPGPFAAKTIDFGHYQGVFEGDQVVAMAGQRMHAFNCAEVSAVCTHPDHTGKGYARALLLSQVNRIKEAGEIPFLHVRGDNERAIKVYEHLGFSVRSAAYFYVMLKAE